MTNIYSLVSTSTPFNFGAKGDGVTDDTAAVQAAVNTGYCLLPAGFTFKVSAPIVLQNSYSLVGQGITSVLSGASVSGGVVQITGNLSTQTYIQNWFISNFAITGSATQAIKLSGAIQGTVSDITVLSAASLTSYGFYFDVVFACRLSNLNTSGVQLTAATGAHFFCGGAFNSNLCDSWYTSGSAAYNCYCEDLNNNGESSGSTFNALTVQGGTIGLYVGNHWVGHTFNGLYTEDCPSPVVLGNNSGNLICQSLTFNSAELGQVYPTHPKYGNRIAAVDFDYCEGITFNSPTFDACFNMQTYAPLTLTGGGGTNAKAIARVAPSGAISSVFLTTSGLGYTSAPTVAVGGSGSGGTASCAYGQVNSFTGTIVGTTLTVTALLSGTPIQIGQTLVGSGVTSGSYISAYGTGRGDVGTYTLSASSTVSTAETITGKQVTGISVTAAGTGYGGPAVMPVTYNNCYRCTIISPRFPGGINTALWPWIVRSSSAQSGSGITLVNDMAVDPGGNNTATATMQKADGFFYQHFISYLSINGVYLNNVYAPPSYP